MVEYAMTYPRIFLTVDNCFAIKRWIRPSTWMRTIQEIGAGYIEASTDNECDPLFATAEYLDDWAEEVLAKEQKRGIKLANFYTGYQTYRTVGLAHHDPRIRENLLNGWLKPMIRLARKVRAAGIGFSFFAMPDEVLQSPTAYAETEDIIYRILAELLAYASADRPVTVSVEQMYAPHQPPWTIEGSRQFLRRLYAHGRTPGYITIDVGHQVGQRRFLRPDRQSIEELLRKGRQGGRLENVWLGPSSAYELFRRALEAPASGDQAAAAEIDRQLAGYPYLFAQPIDGDTYAWLEQLGCYSPIIHMQQNNGVSSHHAPFTAANNRTGIIEGKKLLAALARSYEREPDMGMPPKTGEIYLCFELFASNIDYNFDTLARMRETMEYWRQFVPRDGMPLDKLL
jgi:hypothetical protein